MIRPISSTKPKLLCEQYWEKALKTAVKPKAPEKALPHKFDIADINEILVGESIPYYQWLTESLDKPLEKVLASIDTVFKMQKPTKRTMTLWRGISEPGLIKSGRLSRFNSKYNAKPGEIIYMPEYAFASNDKKYSEYYMKNAGNKRGIIYEIEVPEGSKICRQYHHIFPRSSTFECLDNTEFKLNDKTYRYIKLRYLNPEKNDDTQKSFFQKLLQKLTYFKL